MGSDGPRRCGRCGSTRYVSVSLDEGWTRIAQCVPCGAYGDHLGPGWRGAQAIRDREWRLARKRELIEHILTAPVSWGVTFLPVGAEPDGYMPMTTKRIPTVWVQVVTWLPAPPTFNEQIRRRVRHGMADILDWCGIPVGPKPEDPMHLLVADGTHMVSQELACAIGAPHGTRAFAMHPLPREDHQ